MGKAVSEKTRWEHCTGKAALDGTLGSAVT